MDYIHEAKYLITSNVASSEKNRCQYTDVNNLKEEKEKRKGWREEQERME